MSDSTLVRLISHLTTDAQHVAFRDMDLCRISRVSRTATPSVSALQDLGRLSKSSPTDMPSDQVSDLSQIMDDIVWRKNAPVKVTVQPTLKSNIPEPRPGNSLCRVAKKHVTVKPPKAKTSSRDEKVMTGMRQKTLSPQQETHCLVCSWRFPSQYSEERRQQHRELARSGECRRDVENYNALVQAARRSKQLEEREKLMNGGQLGELSGVKRCPQCHLSLEGCWEEYKRTHMQECWARLSDMELSNSGDHYVIPKRMRDPPVTPDPYSLSFRMLNKRRPGVPQ